MRLFLLLFFLLPGLVWGKGTNRDSIINGLEGIMQELDAVGLSVVVVKNGENYFSASLGSKKMNNSSHRVDLLSDDLFRIASISKTFVATAIMQLIEKDRLHLDDDINKYLSFRVFNPEFPNIPITVRMLLTHRSSINDSQGYYNFEAINPLKNKKFYLCYNKYAPGADYQYSNYNYNLLGAVIEGATGERFDDYIEENITDPLGLNCSFNANRLDSSRFVSTYRFDSLGCTYEVKDVYKPYKWHLSNKNYRKGIYTPLLAPTSGLKISAGDLAKFMIMHINNGMFQGKQIISSQSEVLMRSGYIQSSNYAFSFRKYTGLLPGCVMYGQTGGAYGLFAAMIFDPEKKMGFVVISNGCKSDYIDGYGDLHKKVILYLYDTLIK